MIKKSLNELDLPETFVLKAMYIRRYGFYHGSFFTTPEFMPGSIFFFEVKIYKKLAVVFKEI